MVKISRTMVVKKVRTTVVKKVRTMVVKKVRRMNSEKEPKEMALDKTPKPSKNLQGMKNP
jgi:hypothetical protein